MYDGPIASLEQILDSREQRAVKQQVWVDAHSLPLVSFTINMAGNIKKNHIAKVAFEYGYKAIVNACVKSGMAILKMDIKEAVTGYELLVVVDTCDIYFLKSTMVEIEETHTLGRLFDIDVISKDYHPITRSVIKRPKRRCLVCEQEAKSCIRQQSHSAKDLIKKMTELINACQ
ncbi:citrate lyase holo-[acyl-carrier protein] synthase [Vibrio aestuarianus]|uniref:citrate lyase holo-[acyl-carrier protein] synthase n=2 Tax=Vibrio aestuarianus TaxID=28171 RepID=A0ABM9FLY9_9VIBR|nr:citrate lyase holo-[acyl-carrier protein] synthase [Vibrio aestuarianus]MDE1228666.1 citrate lyase holo-[acyl-carrier protein] synthase [Vibrio aestuarianus]MDE1255245.1 citrate lyase holo-[acyl-carrier protein] synthase [Vibrio aestuarianus]MDE1272810.1 citrate lyase holo-[acyl-carrier protein] synthase [Vibrio aestuarianus]MDE1294179.1 citrate lyase holo-[acyl-carrier protein] synthase [Vibrio aestuarianus]MDE1308324.1 citrate lyase holo-[acyl-carrier protein] synthase [Vibrio aestuarianu